MALSEPQIEPKAPAQSPATLRREVMYRHTVAVRLTHWLNALILVLLLISGLRLFNYHPALYWGNYGYSGVPSFCYGLRCLAYFQIGPQLHHHRRVGRVL